MKKKILIPLIFVGLVSCKTMIVQQELQTQTTQNLQLGTVGELKEVLVLQDYNHTASPDYQAPIKLKVNSVPFTKTKLKAFKKAKHAQNKNISVNYIDSVKIKPTFLKIEIADRVAILNSFKGDTNKAVTQFLQYKTKAHLISTISVVFNPDTALHLSNAQEVFLEQTGVKNYVLKTYQNNKQQQSIHFNEGIVFGYQVSRACWKENNKHQFEIVDLVKKNEKCPRKTYRVPKGAKKNLNYYKF